MLDVDDEAAAADHSADRQAGPLMTLAEAAEAAGRPVEALRAILRRDLTKPLERQRLRPRKGNRGEWLIELPAGLRRPAKPPGRPAVDRHDFHAEEIADRLADLEQVVAGRVADLESALGEARIAAATAAAERNAAKAAATLEGGLLREQLERELARVADLERQLAEARRPFWSRWFGKGSARRWRGRRRCWNASCGRSGFLSDQHSGLLDLDAAVAPSDTPETKNAGADNTGVPFGNLHADQPRPSVPTNTSRPDL